MRALLLVSPLYFIYNFSLPIKKKCLAFLIISISAITEYLVSKPYGLLIHLHGSLLMFFICLFYDVNRSLIWTIHIPIDRV